MFYQYEIISNNGEDILYLYITMKYEFSNELDLNRDKDLARRAKNFIDMNKIPFQGNKVYLVVDGIVVKTLNISNIVGQSIGTSSYSADEYMVSIKLDDNSLCEMSLREFLVSVLFSNYKNNIHDEVLKCICILYNTYAYKMMKSNGYIDNSSFYIYRNPVYYKDIFYNYDELYYKFNTIITEVNCMFLCYDKEYILPFIHFSNNGKTSINSMYPYLSSVKSLWDMCSPYYVQFKDISYLDLSNLLKCSVNCNSHISVIKDNSIKKIVLDQNSFTLEEIKNILSLSSTDLYLIIYKDFLRFITIGCGNSFGLSIFGSNEMAKNGFNYYHILHYYFPKAKLFRYIKELSS